jgi:hypothetical protein
MKSPLFAFSLLVFSTLLLAGCSATPSWVRGDWVFDRDRTEHALNSNPDDDIMKGLAAMLGGALSLQLDTLEVIFTDTDETVTTNGQGHDYPFQVVSKSDTQFVLKKADGTVETYYRDGDGIYSYATGAPSLKIYLKRKT